MKNLNVLVCGQLMIAAFPLGALAHRYAIVATPHSQEPIVWRLDRWSGEVCFYGGVEGRVVRSCELVEIND